MIRPTLRIENEFLRLGYQCIAGIDEVGMGCLAGPVVAAAVILDRHKIPKGINDSKRLTPKQRELLDGEIRAKAYSFGMGSASVEEIDSLNIYHAAKLAMLRAVLALASKPDILLLDGRGKILHPTPQRAIVKGDQKSVSIAAASIVAKVYRDALMRAMSTLYSGYGFASHKGYASTEHREALQKKGPCPLHRKSFTWSPVREPGGILL